MAVRDNTPPTNTGMSCMQRRFSLFCSRANTFIVHSSPPYTPRRCLVDTVCSFPELLRARHTLTCHYYLTRTPVVLSNRSASCVLQSCTSPTRFLTPPQLLPWTRGPQTKKWKRRQKRRLGRGVKAGRPPPGPPGRRPPSRVPPIPGPPCLRWPPQPHLVFSAPHCEAHFCFISDNFL